MDKAKGIVKGGWHPSGDPTIHRKTWKSDVKSIATGKKTGEKGHYENAMAHQSAPLGGLKDPDSFGAPPKHREYYDEQGNSLNPVTPKAVSKYEAPQRSNRPAAAPGGWGAVVPSPVNRKQTEEEQKQAEEEARQQRGPYQKDTTGLRTDNLPPPVRRSDAPSSSTAAAPPARNNISSPPAPPARNNVTSPPVPQRQPQPQAATRPTPTLPPRMNDHPDEYTPPAPPPYSEAAQPAQQDPAAINAGSASRLSQAGVSVPGFGIGGNANGAQQSPTSPQGHGGQLSELQQRFARMNTGAGAQPASPTSPTSSSAAAAAAQKKPPPPPPPKKSTLNGATPAAAGSSGESAAAPPPLPLSSKPRQ